MRVTISQENFKLKKVKQKQEIFISNFFIFASQFIKRQEYGFELGFGVSFRVNI